MHMNPLLRLIIIIMIVMAALSLFREGSGLAIMNLLLDR